MIEARSKDGKELLVGCLPLSVKRKVWFHLYLQDYGVILLPEGLIE